MPILLIPLNFLVYESTFVFELFPGNFGSSFSLATHPFVLPFFDAHKRRRDFSGTLFTHVLLSTFSFRRPSSIVQVHVGINLSSEGTLVQQIGTLTVKPFFFPPLRFPIDYPPDTHPAFLLSCSVDVSVPP